MTCSWLRHVTRINESLLISLCLPVLRVTWLSHLTRINASFLESLCLRVVHRTESCRTYEGWLGHVTHITRVLSQVSMSPSHTCDMTHASHRYEWALCHVSVSPSRSSDWVMSHAWTQTESCRTYKARLSHAIRTNKSFLMSLCLTVCYPFHEGNPLQEGISSGYTRNLMKSISWGHFMRVCILNRLSWNGPS